MQNNQPPIRTRFAPSPTGELHIGGARTALFNYLFAKKNKGEFLLRIEDTDVDRFIPGVAKRIIEALEWLGIKFDGQPVYQSTRLDIYKKSAEKLVVEGRAYWCHCAGERLNELRTEQLKNKMAPKYDELCREKKLKPKKGAVIRLKMPLEGETVVDDLIRGQVVFKNETLDDHVLLKSDGYPTYHLANVVDDHEMQITHVLRAEEWLPSTPKHIVLYQAFGWPLPKFAHLPMILGINKAKLSKRHGATSVLDYQAQGYLPEALINFMAFLGWNPGDEREIFSLQQLEKEFSLEQVGKSAAVFNIEKLNWLNGYYIRQVKLDKLMEMSIPYLEKTGLIKIQKNKFEILETKEIIDFNWIKKIIGLEQERMKKLSEIEESVKFFFVSQPDYPKNLLYWKKTPSTKIKHALQILSKIIKGTSGWRFNKQKIQEKIMPAAEKLGDRGIMLWPMRVALTGQEASPGPFEIAEILGKEKTLKRIKTAIGKLE